MTLEPLAGAADEALVPLDEVVVDDVSVFAEQPATVAPSATTSAHVRKR